MTTLLNSTTATGSTATEGDVKTFLTNIRTFISDLLGTDSSNKGAALAAIAAPLNGTVVKSTGFTVTAADRGKVFACSGALTVNVTAAATLGDGFGFGVWSSGSGVVTIDPNMAETIDGKTTRVVRAGRMVMVYCDGTNFVTVGASELEEFASGAVDMPRITADALLEEADLPVLPVTAADTYTLSIGLSNVGGFYSTTAKSNVLGTSVTINKFSGSARFSISHRAYSPLSMGVTSYVDVYKNGSLIQSWSTASASDVVRSIDITFNAGDIVEFKHRNASNDGTAQSYFLFRSVKASNSWRSLSAIGASA